MRVAPGDPAHRRQAAAEEAFWENPPLVLNVEVMEGAQTPAFRRFVNRSYTGDENTSWMEDLVRRGPFRAAAALGSSQGVWEANWFASRGSESLDVYDISAKVLARTLKRLREPHSGIGLGVSRARFLRADLNFVELPRDRYDVVWTTASLHHVTNLEYLFEEIEASLRPGGLFAVHDYTGEARIRHAPERLARANAVYARIPRRFRLAEQLEAPPLDAISPFEAIRADETLDLARARFDVVHLAQADALYPLFLLVDLAKIEREEPVLLDVLFAAEEEARRDPSLRKCSMYAVFRKRSSN